MSQMRLRIGQIRMGMTAMVTSYHSSSFRAIPRPLPIQSTHRSSDEWRLLRWPSASFNNGAKLSRIFFNLSGSGDRLGFPLFTPVTIRSGVKLQTRALASQVSSSSEGQPEVMDDGKLLKAMVYEAQHKFSNVSGVASRFGEFLYSQLSLRSTSVGDIFASLEKDAKLYDQLDPMRRAQLLDKVAQGMGFFNTQDLISHQFASQEASQDLEVSHEDYLKQHSTPPKPESKEAGKSGGDKALRVELDAKCQEKFKGRQSKPIPSAIKIGSSEPVELYKPHTNRRVVSFPLETGSKVNAGTDACSNSSPGDAVIENAVQQTKKLSRSPLALASIQVTKTPSTSGHDANHVLDAEISNSVPARVKEKLTELMLMRGAAMYKDCVLDIPVTFIKNLSVYQRSRLEENGFHTLRILLQHFPRTYVNFQQAGQRVEDGQHLSFVGVITSSRGLRLSPSLGAVEVIVKSTVDAHDSSDENQEDGQGRTVFLHLKKFFRGARFTNTWFLNKIAAKYPVHAQVAVGGKVKALPLRDHFEIREFNLELWDQESTNPEALDGDKGLKHELEMSGKPYPVYSAKGGLQPKTLEFCIQRILPALPMDLDPVPKYIRDMYDLVELRQAYFGIHTPQDTKNAEEGRQRLVFDEFFYLQLGMLLRRQELADKCLGNLGISHVAEHGNLEMDKWSPLTLKLVNSLPYTLTNSQKNAASEIMWDLQRPVPMSRLLQGDVGCGKTIVAFLGLLEVIDAGYQGALMAPTEFLAIQHYQRIMGWLEVLEDHERPHVALLTGSIPVAKARIIRSGLESGEIVLAVGTHSLIADSVRFASLGLAVVDEQHRFGVAQRGRLNSKGRESNASEETAEKIEGVEGGCERESSTIILSAPHVLAMSATPIPRTLALAIHGDMAISQITELPPGRAQTITQVFHGNEEGRRDAYKMMRKELENGGRVFVVYPVIELSEEQPELRAAETDYEILMEEFEDFQCGLVHGRMKAQEKEAAMELFKAGKSQILVSTTVIEVGIDIPEASMIVIEHAERYGMAQLHQLRGRVGRGSRESKCILLGSTATSLNRLNFLESSNDGFYLAEIDLRLRGPGDLLGKRQSGYIPEFGIARLDQDGDLLEHARSAAEDVLRKHHGLKDLPRLKQELSMRRPPMALG